LLRISMVLLCSLSSVFFPTEVGVIHIKLVTSS
jgi:hypothetical protein